MPSLINGYEYDIFISYRHNDNKSGWVTEFVNALQEELAATIKEPLSIYFDKNPHDGLLETHNVDKSLEGKLKSLIFIPIISQTYCDSKSFAWQHEFCAFNKLSKEDQFGRDIKLSNGNITSRVLPIKIHQLDTIDRDLFEKELGSTLRAIEFIYSEAGVNRPLRSNEENPTRNQNLTSYLNQVNKVANTIKSLIASMTNQDLQTEPSIKPDNHYTDSNNYNKVSSHFSKTRSRLTLILSTVLSSIFAAVITWSWMANKDTDEKKLGSTLTRTSILPSADSHVELIGEGTVGVGRRSISISSKGDKIAYIGNYKGRPHIFIRDLNNFSSKVLEQTTGAYGCTLSPNGQEVGYFVGNKLLKTNSNGGIPIIIAESSNPMDIAWLSDTDLFFSADEGGKLYRVGKQVELVSSMEKFTTISIIPETTLLLVSSYNEIGVFDFNSNQYHKLGLQGSGAKFVYPNRVMYMRGSTLMSQPIDLNTYTANTEKSYSLPNVRVEAYGSGQYDMSENGSLVYIEGKDARIGNLIMVSRSGKVDTVTQTKEEYRAFKLSPDETKLAVPIQNASQDLWVIDLRTSKRTRITKSGGASNPVWMDNDKLIYRHDTIVYIINIENDFYDELFREGQPSSISADGKKLLFLRDNDLFLYNMETEDISQITKTDFSELHGSISPNGKLVTYTLDDSKAFHVYLKQAELGCKNIQISTGEGSEEPRWTHDGNRIIYRSGQQWFEVTILDFNKLEVSQPKLVLDGDYFNIGGFSYDITGDGDKFILVKATEEKTASEIKLITGWIEEVNR